MLPRISLRGPVAGSALLLVLVGMLVAGQAAERGAQPADAEEPLTRNDGLYTAWRTTSDPLAEDPAQFGQWDLPMDWPAVAVHAILMRTGKVLFFRGDEDDVPTTYVWDPATNQISSKPVPDIVWCSGNSVLEDGRVLITGGSIYPGGTTGALHAYIFDPLTTQWTRTVDMRAGRYYPSNVLMGDGRTLVFSGTDENGITNPLVEAFVPGSTGPDSFQLLPGAERSITYYPRFHMLPSGQVVHIGPDRNTYVFNPSNMTWQPVSTSLYGNRTHGTSVMLPPGFQKIMILGGRDRGKPDPLATNTVEILDMSAPTPRWTSAPPMTWRRMHANTVILPTGKVLVAGGTTDEDLTPAYPAEMYDPVAGTWTVMASQRTRRGYHSSALLLPDGRVLWAGANGNYTAEVYSPPYLFRGARPVIGSAPGAVPHSGTMSIGSLDAASIASVVLMRPGVSTHAINIEQRYVPLAFSQTGASTLVATAPIDQNVAPPGYYMLFLVNTSGVPSVARWVRLGAIAGGNQRPVVDAGPGSTIILPADATLNGTVTDDGLPSATLSVAWTKESGPGSVVFAAPGSPQSAASFSTIGTYVLRLTGTDGQLSGTDTVSITVTDGVSGGFPVEVRITNAADDVEEKAGGSMADSSDLELVFDSTVQTVGLRFPNLAVRQGERIVRAWIQFKTDEATSDATALQIYGQNVDNAPAFTTTSFNVSSRTLTPASVSWAPPPWLIVGEVGPNQRTPDITPIIQQIVNRPGWSSGNALVVVIKGSGKRVAEAWEDLPLGAALLHVEIGSSTPPSNRVPTVDPGPPVTVRIPNPVLLNGTVTDDGLPNPPGALQTLWFKETGPLTGVVTFAHPQAIDTTATFSEPGTYVLELQADDGELVGLGAVSVVVNPPAQVVTLDRTVSAGSDDAQQVGGKTKAVTLNLGYLPMGDLPYVGVRFTDIAIPKGSVIQGAWLQLQTDMPGTASSSLQIRGQAADNAPTFAAVKNDLGGRTRTTASISWAPPAWPSPGEAGGAQKSPNLAPIVQEIVNRAGWTSGNAMVFLITGSGTRFAESFEGGAFAAPRLRIEYTEP